MTDSAITQAARHDPSSLYAAAIGALHLSPGVQAALSPVGAQLFTAAYNAAAPVAGDALSVVGQAALNGAIEAVGPEFVSEVSTVAGAVASVIGDAIPLVNVFVGILQVLGNPAFAATGSDTTAADCAAFWNAQPGSSGPSNPKTGNTYTTPSDIFASSETWTGNHMPISALGVCLAAITECDASGDGEDAPIDGGLLHSCWAFDRLPGWFKSLFPDEPDVGIPPASRPVFRALRLAMAANGQDHGAFPYALYMDLLVAAFNSGQLTLKWIAFLLSSYLGRHYVGSMFVPELRSGPCGGAPAQAMAHQIVALIRSWEQTRTQIDFRRKPARIISAPKPKQTATTAEKVGLAAAGVAVVGGLAAGIIYTTPALRLGVARTFRKLTKGIGR